MLRQAYLLRGSFTRVLPLFIWIGIDMILWGFISKYLNTVATPGFNFVTTLLGAILLWDFFVRVMHGVTMGFLEDVWSRNFLNFFATPLKIPEYLSGLVLWAILTSIIGLTVMMLLANAFFGLSFLEYGMLLIPFLLILFLFGIALGIVGCAIVLRLGPASEWFIWPIPSILSPFAAVFYPVSTLPEWMRPVSLILPPSYVFEGIRAIVQGHGVPLNTLFGGAALCVVYIWLACVLFMTTYRHATRTGLIARYSVESVS